MTKRREAKRLEKDDFDLTEIEIADVVDDGSEKLESKYVRVKDAVRWEDNPKRHDEPGLIDSISKYGFRDAPIWDATLGAIAGGNGRTHALLAMFDRGDNLPRGILLDSNGDWCMPIQFGLNAESIAQAEAFAVDHNNLTMNVGDLTIYDVAQMWENEEYFRVLERLENEGSLPLSVTDDDFEFLKNVGEALGNIPKEVEQKHVEFDATYYVAQARIRFQSAEHLEDALSQIRSLLDGHPHWGADIEVKS